jgi:hypothetical protein
VPSLMQEVGISVQDLAPPDFGAGCECPFALRMNREKGTVEVVGFFFAEEHRFVIGIAGMGRNPLHWLKDYRLSEEVKRLLMERGMKPLSDP